MCPDLKVECEESRTFSAANFTVSSEFTFGDNKFVLLCFFTDLADREFTAYLAHAHPDFFSVDELSNSHIEQTRGIRLFFTSGARQGNPAV